MKRGHLSISLKFPFHFLYGVLRTISMRIKVTEISRIEVLNYCLELLDNCFNLRCIQLFSKRVYESALNFYGWFWTLSWLNKYMQFGFSTGAQIRVQTGRYLWYLVVSKALMVLTFCLKFFFYFPSYSVRQFCHCSLCITNITIPDEHDSSGNPSNIWSQTKNISLNVDAMLVTKTERFN